jgi:UDP-3-O-[3-hydroxymyristoyl] glucosamine N-acyltransferase
MVHVGHDTRVGANCLFAAQVGIAGGTIIEEGVTLWGQVGVNKTITIGAHATVMGQSGVTASLKGGKTYLGYPAEEAGLKEENWYGLKEFRSSGKK